jgi:hypothetical protein
VAALRAGNRETLKRVKEAAVLSLKERVKVNPEPMCGSV